MSAMTDTTQSPLAQRLEDIRWDVSEEDYHRNEENLTSSKLRRYLKHPKTPPPDGTSKPIRLGSWIGVALLQPEKWEDRVVVPVKSRRSKTFKRAVEESTDEGLVLTEPEMEIVDNATDSILKPRSPMAEEARDILVESKGICEWAIRWEELAYGGLKGAAMYDKATPEGRVLRHTELKATSKGVDPESFSRVFWGDMWRYDIQAAWYRRGAMQKGIDKIVTTVVVVRYKPPYEVAVYHIHPDDLREAEDHIEAALTRIEREKYLTKWEEHGEPIRLHPPSWRNEPPTLIDHQ